MTANTEAPPLTRCPLATRRFAWPGKITFTREPNLMSPTRWPRSMESPSLKLKTMRRAIAPAIWLKVTVKVFTLHGDHVLLVLSRFGIEGVEELALLIADLAYGAGNGRAVDVHIKNAEKDTQANALSRRGLDAGDLGDFSVCRRNHQAGLGRHGTLGIAKEPQKEAGQQDGDNGPGPMPGYQEDQNASRKEAKTIEVSVTNHVCAETLGEL